jgi:uncharacterized Tic20 family protein
MTSEPTLSPTSDERLLAALAHFLGIMGALIIWLFQKDKSRFVRFQAVQALAFHFAFVAVMMTLLVCLFGVTFIGVFGTIAAAASMSSSPENASPFLFFPFLFMPLSVTCIFPFMLLMFIAQIVAAVSVLNGNDFRYPFLGAQVEKFLAD